MDSTHDEKQPELLRFIQILDNRIATLEERIKEHEQVISSQASMLRSLRKQKEMMSASVQFIDEPRVKGEEQWIHINEARQYPELPQPSTIRGYIRDGLLKEGEHYKKVGVRGLVYINATSVVAKIQERIAQ
jgi:uncharacterized coiled-coil protein SlyX